MGDHQGGGSFGFAPRGEPARHRADGSRPAPMREEQGAPSPRPARAPAMPPSYKESSEKPLWLWLGIGILLGVGTTLLTSSLWLPERGNGDLAEFGAGESVTPADDVALAAEPTTSASASPVPEVEALPALEPASSSATSSSATSSSNVSTVTESTTSSGGVAASSQAQAAQTEPDEPAAPTVEAQLAALGVEDAVIRPEVSVTRGNKPEPGAEPGPTQTGRLPAAKPSNPRPESERLLPPEPIETTSVDSQPAKSDARAALDASTSRPETPEAEPSKEPDKSPLATGSPVTSEPPGVASVAAAKLEELTSKAEEADPSNDTNLAQLSSSRTTAQASRPRSSSASVPSNGRLYRVQLAAVNDEAAARVYWREVNERLPGVFDDIEPVFNQRVVDERLYLRIWVGSFNNRGEADTYCSWLKEQGQDCFVTRVDNL